MVEPSTDKPEVELNTSTRPASSDTPHGSGGASDGSAQRTTCAHASVQPGAAIIASEDKAAPKGNPAATLPPAPTRWPGLGQLLFAPATNCQSITCIVLWLLLLAGIGVATWLLLPLLVDHVIDPALQWLKTHLKQWQIALIVAGALAVTSIVLISPDPFFWLAGLALGLPVGTAICMAGVAIGMLLPFLIGRKLLTHRIQAVVHKRRMLEVVLTAVKDAGAFKVVFLLRLGPIPYTVTNYAASMSPDIGVIKYWTASMIGVVPHVLINCYLGRSIGGISQLLQGRHVSKLQIIDYTIGITASVVVTVLALVYSRRALLKIQNRAEAEGEVVPVTGSVEKSDASHNMERGILPSDHQDSAAAVPDEMPVWVAPAGASQQLCSHPIADA